MARLARAVVPGRMLDPAGYNNAWLHGSVWVVKATLSVPDPIPHSGEDDPVTLTWSVSPPETELYAPYGGFSVIVGIYDPASSGGWTAEKWWAVGPGTSGNIQWDGLLDIYYYGNLFAENACYCSARTVFALVTVTCCNRHLYYSQICECPVTFDFPAFPVLLDLDIYSGGSDLDNGQASGSQGGAVSEADEEIEGAYLLVNWDDDDADGVMNADGTWSALPVPDLTENSVANEDNLAQIAADIDPLPYDGTVELAVSGADAGKVKLWTQSTKGTQVTLSSNKKIWNLANPQAVFQPISIDRIRIAPKPGE